MQLRHHPNGRKTMHGEILVRHLWERLQQKNPAARAQNGSRQLEPNPTADSWFGLRLVYVTRLVPAPLTRMHRDRNAQTIWHSHSDHRRVHSAIAGSELRMGHFLFEAHKDIIFTYQYEQWSLFDCRVFIVWFCMGGVTVSCSRIRIPALPLEQDQLTWQSVWTLLKWVCVRLRWLMHQNTCKDTLITT